MQRRKRDTTRNIACSISFFSAFRVISWKIDYFWDSVGQLCTKIRNIWLSLLLLYSWNTLTGLVREHHHHQYYLLCVPPQSPFPQLYPSSQRKWKNLLEVYIRLRNMRRPSCPSHLLGPTAAPTICTTIFGIIEHLEYLFKEISRMSSTLLFILQRGGHAFFLFRH